MFNCNCILGSDAKKKGHSAQSPHFLVTQHIIDKELSLRDASRFSQIEGLMVKWRSTIDMAGESEAGGERGLRIEDGRESVPKS